MTISADDRRMLDLKPTLTDNEQFLVSHTLDTIYANAKQVGVTLLNDDVCVTFEAAIIRFIVSSKPKAPTAKVRVETDNYTIELDPARRYGTFEHKTRGEFSAGGLWFDPPVPGGTPLRDYDGVPDLPGEVRNWLKQHGFILED